MERRHTPRPQRILLVDDSDDIREMWRLWLTYWGFAVEEARNGAEALVKARTQRPDLILMDLTMPVLDGRSTIRALASEPTTAGVPVLAMSAQLPSEEEQRPAAERFCQKPTEPDRLLERIRVALRPSPWPVSES